MASACGFIPVFHSPQAGAAGTIMPTVFLFKLVQRIREEFDVFPELRMTVTEAARFWGLDRQTCECVLAELLRAGFLARGPDHRYRLAS
jgi:DNA-binding IclR family transcriptional regulator